MPHASTTTSASMSPRSVRTPVTRPSWCRTSSTRTPSRMLAPWRRAPSPIASGSCAGSARPSSGSQAAPMMSSSCASGHSSAASAGEMMRTSTPKCLAIDPVRRNCAMRSSVCARARPRPACSLSRRRSRLRAAGRASRCDRSSAQGCRHPEPTDCPGGVPRSCRRRGCSAPRAARLASRARRDGRRRMCRRCHRRRRSPGRRWGDRCHGVPPSPNALPNHVSRSPDVRSDAPAMSRLTEMWRVSSAAKSVPGESSNRGAGSCGSPYG